MSGHTHRSLGCEGIEKQMSGEDPFHLHLDDYGSICLNLAMNLAGLIPIVVMFFIVKRRAWNGEEKEDKPTFSSWLLEQFSISDMDKIDDQFGIDVGNFFLFQQYLIYFSFLELFVCITLVLPLNLSGKVEINNIKKYKYCAATHITTLEIRVKCKRNFA